jgi:hypothetical protein
MGSQLGVKTLKSHCGLCILGLDVGPCIHRVCLCIAFVVFPKLEHFTVMNFML